MARTAQEITDRIEAVGDDDFFGFAREVLIPQLPYDDARPFLKPEVTAQDWQGPAEPETIEEEARGYLDFAIKKILGHRGISASRSVSKLTEYAWLLGRDDVVAAMEEADYAQYGAPKIKAFAEGMSYPWPVDCDLDRMAAGLPCEPDCGAGCGL
jgi:hypothetical protein